MRLSADPQLDDSQRDLLERVSGRRIDPPRAFLMWAHNPGLAEHVEGLLAYCRRETTIPLRLRVLGMLTVGRRYESPSMWNAHYTQAIEAGVDADALDRLRHGKDPMFGHEDERTFYAFANELLERHHVSDQTYATALAAFGEATLLDIVACLGAYTLSSYALNTFQLALRPEEGLPFTGLDPAIAGWYAASDR